MALRWPRVLKKRGKEMGPPLVKIIKIAPVFYHSARTRESQIVKVT
jgi:hypothetical protein